jgi:hypothetical protein
MFCDLEPKPLFEPDGPKHASRILHEREVMKNTDHPFLDVFDAPEEIDQFSEPPGVQLESKDVNREVATERSILMEPLSTVGRAAGES